MTTGSASLKAIRLMSFVPQHTLRNSNLRAIGEIDFECRNGSRFHLQTL